MAFPRNKSVLTIRSPPPSINSPGKRAREEVGDGSQCEEDKTSIILRGIQHSLDNLVAQNKLFLEDFKEVKTDLAAERDRTCKLEAKIELLESKLNRLESHQNIERRKNLIFTGMPSTENDAESIKNVCKDMLGLDDTKIFSTSKIGPKKTAILVKFDCESSVESILRKSARLKGTNIYIDRDYSFETRQRRNGLLKIKKKIKEVSSDAKVLVRGEVLVVDGKKFHFNKDGNFVCNKDDGLIILNNMFECETPICLE